MNPSAAMPWPRFRFVSMSATGGGDDPELHLRIESELPREVAVGRGNMLLLHGWCFHTRRPIRHLELLLDGEAQPLAYGTPRPDVARDHAESIDDRGDAYHSGFLGLLTLREVTESREVEIRLAASLAGGGVASTRVGEVRLEPGERRTWAGLQGGEPQVAICMATFDPPPELFRRQIESIRAQTHQNWICLISDDDSRPEAFATITETVGDDPRFRIERNPRRLGVYRNFERVLSLVPTETPLVALADQDDRWDREKLAVLVQRVAGGAAIAYSDARITTADGKTISPTFWTERANNPDDLGALLLVNSITGGAALFRSELLDHMLPFPATEGTMHDHWMAMVAMSLGEVSYVNRPLYDYVQHSGAALGHESMRRPGARQHSGRRPRDRGTLRRSIAERFEQIRLCYYIVLSVRAAAELLLLRGGAAISRRKRRALRRCARLERSPLAWGWLAGLMIRSLIGRSKTMGVERLMLAGSLWRPMLRMVKVLRLPAPGPHPPTMAAMLKLPHSPQAPGSEPRQPLIDEEKA
jgi:glycosyltransferase involved in cell wall biosynthesis